MLESLWGKFITALKCKNHHEKLFVMKLGVGCTVTNLALWRQTARGRSTFQANQCNVRGFPRSREKEGKKGERERQTGLGEGEGKGREGKGRGEKGEERRKFDIPEGNV